MVEKVFFQSSFPRAGSTLFQNIISQNPDFYVTPTSGILELWYAARSNYTNSPEFKAQDAELMKKGFAGFCREGMFGYFNAITDRKFVMDKSRGHGFYRDFIDTFYPDPKIIVLVRDIRDVVCSYEKIFRKTQHLHDPMRDDSKARATTVPKRVDEWMHPTNTIGRAVERLSDIIRQGNDTKMLFIKYEDLAMYPEAQMQKVYAYLGVPYFEHDFDNIPQTTEEDDTVYGLGDGLHTIRPKLESRPSDAAAILGKDVTTWIYENYKWFYDYFRYQK